MNGSEAQNYTLCNLTTEELGALIADAPPEDEFAGALLDEYDRRPETDMPEFDALRAACKRQIGIGRENTSAEKRKKRKPLRAVLIAAAAAALLIGAAYAAGALGWLPQWDNELFEFSKEAQSILSLPEGAEYKTLEEALAAVGAPENIVPHWLPEGYEPAEFDVYIDHDAMIADISLFYACEGRPGIGLVYTYIGAAESSFYTKDKGDPEIYTVGVVEHYIMTNVGDYFAVWQCDSFECEIFGFESREELIKTIDSMYE